MTKIVLLGGLEYSLEEDGRLLKRRGKGYRKAFADEDGYLKYTICTKDGTVNYQVHRIVYETFIGEIPQGLTVDHKNSDKGNNHWRNLQLMTPENNAVKGNARNWKVVSPMGQVYEVYNLKDFCRENNLHQSHIVSSTYKGWKAYEQQ